MSRVRKNANRKAPTLAVLIVVGTVCFVASGAGVNVLLSAFGAQRPEERISSSFRGREAAAAPARPAAAAAAPHPPPDSGTVAGWTGTTCQSFSNHFGADHATSSWGPATPEVARVWWVSHKCTTSPDQRSLAAAPHPGVVESRSRPIVLASKKGRLGSSSSHALFAQIMDEIQRSCHNPQTIILTSHGMGVDLMLVVTQVLIAFKSGRAFRLQSESPKGWHYSRGVCAALDLTCFFETTHLPCTPNAERVPAHRIALVAASRDDAMLYITRSTARLRLAIDKRTAEVGLNPSVPCAVVHVRRSDVTLNKGWGQFGNKSAPSLFRYIPLEEYLTTSEWKLKELGVKELLLMTDDKTAIEEVDGVGSSNVLAAWRSKWRWVKRERFRGSEGGWENHFPSGDRFEEAATVLALREMAHRCKAWVGTRSSFGQFMRLGMNPPLSLEARTIIELETRNPKKR